MKPMRLLHAIANGNCLKGHFGQWAEDVVIHKLFPREYKTGIYVDIGAYHPFTHSNTAYLWLKGWRGVNVDANPNSIELFKKTRPNDININGAIVPQDFFDENNSRKTVPLYLPKSVLGKSINACGTCDVVTANNRGFANDAALQIPAYTINEILEASLHANERIDYLNIDIEGMDEAVLVDVSWQQFTPIIVSIEDYSENLVLATKSKICQLMNDVGYNIVARVGPTSIFKWR